VPRGLKLRPPARVAQTALIAAAAAGRPQVVRMLIQAK
jgi:hypothetical protein